MTLGQGKGGVKEYSEKFSFVHRILEAFGKFAHVKLLIISWRSGMICELKLKLKIWEE